MAHDETQQQKIDTGLTRREWLLKLGEAAVLLGLAGPAGLEATAMTSDRPPQHQHQSAVNNLPAGLYEPSPDHLTHALAMNGPFVRIPAGSETLYAQPQSGPYHPRFFTSDEYQVVLQLIDQMLDASPRAVQNASELQSLDVSTRDEIAQWIDLTVDNAASTRQAAEKLSEQHRTLAIHFFGTEAVDRHENAAPQKTWQEGLEWLSAASHQRYGKPFHELDADHQAAILESVSDSHAQKQPANAGTRLFALL